MADRQDKFSGTMAQREGFEIDAEILGPYLEAYIEGLTLPITIDQFKGGQSNPTYRLKDANGKPYVLRRKPPGKLLKSAHAIDREYKVITALYGIGFPVPKAHHLCLEDQIIGTWFYVMDLVEGRIFWDGSLPTETPQSRGPLFDTMNKTLADLHMVDYKAIGLGDYGKGGNYFERQISRWSTQYLNDKDAGSLDAMDRLIEWLPENIPAGDETSITHGDFRIDNMIMDQREPKVVAVLDWELSTLGHPLSDFSYNCLPYRLPNMLFSGLKNLNLESLGIPSEEGYINAYCKRVGRGGIENFDFYIAFNLFRLASITHGILGRVKRGTATSQHAIETAHACQPLAELSWNEALKVIHKSQGI